MMVRVWDAQTGQSVMDSLKGHGAYIASVPYSPDGRHIVSGSADNTVRVWDAQTSPTVMDPFTVSCISTSNIPVVLPTIPIHFEGGNNIDMSDSYESSFFCSSAMSMLKNCHLNGNWVMLGDNAYLLWVPHQNISGLIWPRTIAVMGCPPTSLQFTNFVHGTNWSQCFSL